MTYQHCPVCQGLVMPGDPSCRICRTPVTLTAPPDAPPPPPPPAGGTAPAWAASPPPPGPGAAAPSGAGDLAASRARLDTGPPPEPDHARFAPGAAADPFASSPIGGPVPPAAFAPPGGVPAQPAPPDPGALAATPTGFVPPGAAPAPPPGSQPPYGQPLVGQPAYGQPAYGQPPYGQPPSGQPPYGQPAYGQPAYGPQAYGQPVQGAPPGYVPPAAGQSPLGYGQASPGFGQAPPYGQGPPGYGPPPGYPQVPGYPPFGAPPAKRSGHGLVVVVAIVSVLVVFVASLVVVGSKYKKDEIAFPATWDPRVQYAVTFIEADKGRPFDHPVAVEFLPDEQFKEDISASASAQTKTDEQKKALEQQTGEMRALGLVQGELDLGKETTTLSSGGTAAYYDPKTKVIRVRGTDLNLAVKGTIVHELTHAWQDQHYDLERLKQLPSSQEQDAFRTLAEGDATNSEDAWIEKLSAADHEAYEQQTKKDGQTAKEDIKTVPDVLIAQFGAPYEFGPSFMQGLKADGGQSRLDQTWANPPKGDHQILEPWSYLDGSGAPKDVPTPETGGPEAFDEGSFGALFLYLTLAERIDPQQAMKALDAYAGDSYTAYEDGGKVCVKATVAGSDDAANDTLRSAFSDWGKTLPQVASVDKAAAGGVDIKACDPGAGATFGYNGRASKVIQFPTVRLIIWAQRLEQGDTEAQAKCLGNAFVSNLTLQDLDKPPIPDARVVELRAAATKTCPR
jgi:hypothetical protein